MKVRKRRGKRPQAPGATLHNDRLAKETADKRNQALALRIQGVPPRTIAERLGVAKQTVYRYIADAIADIPTDNARLMKALLLERCERTELQTNLRLAKQDLGDLEFARLQAVLIRNRDQIAKLEGAYAAEKHEHSVVDRINAGTVREMSDDDLRRIASGDFSPVTSGTPKAKA